jgi:hypothetical protein
MPKPKYYCWKIFQAVEKKKKEGGGWLCCVVATVIMVMTYTKKVHRLVFLASRKVVKRRPQDQPAR